MAISETYGGRIPTCKKSGLLLEPLGEKYGVVSDILQVWYVSDIEYHNQNCLEVLTF